MTKRRTLVLVMVGALLAPGSGEAQSLADVPEVTLRAGEHADFTRLALDLPDRREWSISAPEDGGGAVLTLAGGVVSFDLTSVFNRIGTDRLRMVEAAETPNTIELSFNCDCGVRSFLHDGRMLVLDIAEDAPKPTGDAPKAETRVDLPILPSMVSLGPGGRVPRAYVEELALPDPEALADTSASVTTTLFEERLIRQISEAASQGFLQPGLTSGQKPSAQEDVPSAEPAASPSVVASAPFDPEVALKGASTTDGRLFLTRNECPPSEAFDFASADRFGGKSFSQVIGPLRSALYSEIDAPRADAAADLAQAYLHFGFGAEARALLEKTAVPDLQTLLAVAAVIDDGRDPDAEPLRDLLHCSTAAAFWSALVEPVSIGPEGLDEVAILSAFDALNDQLKVDLGPRILHALADLGSTETADNILIRLERGTDTTTPAFLLARARLARAKGEGENAKTTLKAMARTEGASAPQAIVELFEDDFAPDPEADADLVELADAFATEFEKTDEAGDFWRTNLRALLRSGQMDAAFALLEDAPPNAPDLVRNAQIEAFQALVAVPDDMTFLKHAITRGPRFRDVLPPGTSTALATRLFDAGFLDAAQELLPGSSDQRQNRDQRLLSAKIALRSGAPEAAEIALIGLQGPEVDALRIEAREAMGDFGFAEGAHDAAGRKNAAEQSALAAGDWQRLRDSEDPALQRAAALALADGPDAQAGSPTLSAAQTLLEDSAAARDTIAALLARARQSDLQENDDDAE